MQHPCAELQGVLLIDLSVSVGVTLIIARSAAHCFGNDVDATSTPSLTSPACASPVFFRSFRVPGHGSCMASNNRDQQGVSQAKLRSLPSAYRSARSYSRISSLHLPVAPACLP
jgi:hypothetical protein